MSKPIVAGAYRTFRDLNPGETYIEYEGSTITIPIRGRAPGGDWIEERLKLSAFMRLEVFPAYVNQLGTREFQFVIRDWELYGYSPLLNELFMGDERGYLPPNGDPRRGREQVVMTFTVSDHYEKHDDDDNDSLGPASELKISDVTHHDTLQGDLYWQISRAGRGQFNVRFHRKPPDEKGSAQIGDGQDLEYVLAEATGVKPGGEFVATAINVGVTVPSRGNTVLTQSTRLRTPISFRWRLGSNPKAGTVGRLRVVSPPKSLCVADQGPTPGEPEDSCDFPARITYCASYDIFINNTRFVEDQAGIAIAVGVDRIPPVDVKVAFQKPHLGDILGRYIQFGPGWCTGMLSIPLDVYVQGVRMAQYWRSVRLDTQQGRRPPAIPD